MSTSCSIEPIDGEGIKGFMLFPRGISPKVNVIAGLEFELAYCDTTILHISHYLTRTHPAFFVWQPRMSLDSFLPPTHLKWPCVKSDQVEGWINLSYIFDFVMGRWGKVISLVLGRFLHLAAPAFLSTRNLLLNAPERECLWN